MIPDFVVQRLRHVRVSDPSASLDHFPTFLIIGPQRTGTTWLHAHLRFHPQIFLAEPKELFFFSRLKEPDNPKFQSNDLGWYLRFFREPLWRRLAKNAICLWRYREIYRPAARGEATASYATLDSDVIREIATLNPDIKAILMVRDPIERAWSHAKKDLVRNRNRRLEEVGDDEFRAFFADPYQRRCARYAANIQTWTEHLKPGHLFVGFFADIASRPEQLLLDVMSFLGVASSPRYVSSDVRASVNPTESSAIPPQHRVYLEQLLADDISGFRARFSR